MLCRHVSIKTPTRGSSDFCPNCQLPIVFDGEKWRWELELDRNLVKEWRRSYQELRHVGRPA